MTATPAIDAVQERNPLLPRSQARRQSMVMRRNSMRHHAIWDEKRGWFYLCNCGGGIRGVTGFNKLGRRRRRDWRWADDWRRWIKWADK